MRRDFGGQANVEAHLAADSLTLVAALVIILTDCTWNVATGLGLRVGCIRKSTRPGHFEIHSFKARADKPQIATLPNKALGPSRLTVRDVVGMVLEMTGRARALAEPDLGDLLLIFRPTCGSCEERLSDNRQVPTWLGNCKLSRTAFRALQRAWGWSDTPYTLDMIRPTALVRRGLTAGVLAAQATAGHATSGTTLSYVSRYALRAAQRREIRRLRE